MLEKAKGYGYKKIGFILDRGYFSKKNLEYMDHCGYDFIILVKGMAALVEHLIFQNKGSFEEDRDCSVREYKVYGKTIERKLYESDTVSRSMNLFYSDIKKSKEREALECKLERMGNGLKRMIGKETIITSSCEHYFEPFYGKDGKLAAIRDKKDVIKKKWSGVDTL